MNELDWWSEKKMKKKLVEEWSREGKKAGWINAIDDAGEKNIEKFGLEIFPC